MVEGGPYNCKMMRIGHSPYLMCDICGWVFEEPNIPPERVHHLCKALLRHAPKRDDDFIPTMMPGIQTISTDPKELTDFTDYSIGIRGMVDISDESNYGMLNTDWPVDVSSKSAGVTVPDLSMRITVYYDKVRGIICAVAASGAGDGYVNVRWHREVTSKQIRDAFFGNAPLVLTYDNCENFDGDATGSIVILPSVQSAPASPQQTYRVDDSDNRIESDRVEV